MQLEKERFNRVAIKGKRDEIQALKTGLGNGSIEPVFTEWSFMVSAKDLGVTWEKDENVEEGRGKEGSVKLLCMESMLQRILSILSLKYVANLSGRFVGEKMVGITLLVVGLLVSLSKVWNSSFCDDKDSSMEVEM